VAEQEGEVVVDATVAVVQVGVADPARLHCHDRIPWAGVGNDDGLHFYRRALGRRDDSPHLLRHDASSHSAVPNRPS